MLYVSIYFRFFSRFTMDASDNNMVNIFPIGDSIYTAGEMNYLIKVDPETLDRVDKVNNLKCLLLKCQNMTLYFKLSNNLLTL